MKSKTKKLDSNKKEWYPPYSPKTKLFLRISGPQEQVIPNLKDPLQSKSMEHTSEIQVDFSGSKINEKPAGKNESEENIAHVDENIDVSEQPCNSKEYENEQQLALFTN